VQSPIFGAKRTVWSVWGQNYFTRKLHFIWPRKPPKSFFQKTRFLSELFYKSAPHKLSGLNGVYGAIGGKIVPERSFISLKKHVLGPNFFAKPSPHLFLGPNGLFGEFWGKTISHENFTSFGPVSHRILFSKKHVFFLNFYTKAHLTNYRGKRTIWRDWGQN
jgi:hypothetical protein